MRDLFERQIVHGYELLLLGIGKPEVWVTDALNTKHIMYQTFTTHMK